MSNIHGMNFDNQIVTAKDHGRLFQCIIGDGVLAGCELSSSGAVLRVAPGYLIVAGRELKLTANTSINVDGATSGYARVLISIDLTQTASTESFEQAAFSVEYASTQAGFPALTQEDVNGAGLIYEFPLCIVSLNSNGIASILSPAGAAKISAILGDETVTTEQIADGAVSNTKLSGPILISKGGTGASTGAAGIKNLFAAGKTVLSSYQYGSTLPAAGTAGRIFFKLV